MVGRRFGNSITDHWQSDPDDALDASHNSPDYDCNEQVARMNNSDREVHRLKDRHKDRHYRQKDRHWVAVTDILCYR